MFPTRDFYELRRWSRIARKLPGRTDNEIKNYWRTHMRKEAQERRKQKKASSSSSSSSSASSSSNSSSSASAVEEERSFYDTGGVDDSTANATKNVEKKSGLGLEVEEGSKVYSMDDIWKEFEFSEGLTSPTVVSPTWDDYCTTDSLWCMNIEEESKMLMHQSFPFCNNMIG